jgi:hypothetical protein
MPTLPDSVPTFATATGSNVVTGLNVNTITYQGAESSGQRIVRYTFNSSPDLSPALAGHYLVVVSATNANNNGTYKIKAVSDASDYIDVYNNARIDSTLDEASDSPATAIVQDNGAVKTPFSAAKLAQGWLSPEKPADGHFNFWMNLVGQWIQYASDGGFAELQIYADIATLKAVDTTTILNNSKHLVTGFGAYQYMSASTSTADNESVLLPASGTGRYHLIIPDPNAIFAYVSPILGELQSQIDTLADSNRRLEERIITLEG